MRFLDEVMTRISAASPKHMEVRRKFSVAWGPYGIDGWFNPQALIYSADRQWRINVLRGCVRVQRRRWMFWTTTLLLPDKNAADRVISAVAERIPDRCWVLYEDRARTAFLEAPFSSPH